MFAGNNFGKRVWLTACLAALICCAALFLPALPARAFTTEEIDARQVELEEVQERRQLEESTLEAHLNREAFLQDQLEKLESRLEELRREQERLKQEIAAVEEEIARTEQELSEAEERLSHREELLNQRLRAIQQYGVVSYFEVLFESSNFSDFLTRLYNLRIIAANDLRLIEEIRAERAVIRAWKEELEQNRADLEEMRRQVAANEEEIKRERAEKVRVLDELREEIARALQTIENLEAEAQRLDDLIQQLIAEAQSRFSGVEGALHWPIEPPTWISSGYGWRIDPFGGHQAWHGGLDLAPHNGAANYILAAARGEVIFSGWNGGYGNCIMIDHGGGTVTLYGHLSALLVAAGDVVDKGERIGRAGTTGYSTGVHLHFEVREYETEPVRSFFSGAPDYRHNPMLYFQ